MTDSRLPNEDLTLSTVPSSPGGKLAAAREEWDLTVEDIARSLNLGADTIRALENDDYDGLPGFTFVRGYLRSYASLLNLDPDELVRGFTQEPERLRGVPAPRGSLKRKGQVPVSTRPKKKKKSGGGRFLRFLLLVLVLAGIAWGVVKVLPTLDMKEISELLKLPAPEEEAASDDEIRFGTEETDSDQNRGALIPIE